MHIVSVCCIFMLYIKSRWVTALLAANTYPIKFELKYKKCRKYMLLILAQQDQKKIWLMEKWLKAHKGSRLQIAIIEIAHKWDKSTWNSCKGPLWKVSVCTIINLLLRIVLSGGLLHFSCFILNSGWWLLQINA